MRRPETPTILLAALVAVSTLLRFWGGTLVPTPWITPDEVIYGMLGRSLWHSASFRLLGRPEEFLSLIYPALVGAPLSIGSLGRGYELAKLLQALVMSLTAVPVYLWARTLAARGWAVVAAALTLALPGLGYSGLLMTEVAFTPLVVLAAVALARALERPTLVRQALLVAACVACALTRLQAAVLLPVLVTAAVLDAALARRPRKALALAPSAGALVALGLAWAGWRLRHGGPLSRVFAGYEPAGQAHYALGRALRFVLYHGADLAILCGLAPLLALVVLFAVRDRTPALAAYLATASSLCLWFCLEVGLFASEHVGLLAERNLLPLAPVLFVGLAAWLERGAPRPRIVLGATSVAIVALLAYLPVRRLVPDTAFPDAFTLFPLIKLAREHPHANLDLFVPLAAGVALAAVAIVPRRALVLIPLAIFVALAGISFSATREIGGRARILERDSTGPDHRWIDRRATGPTAYLYLGELNWPGVWETIFWNRRIVGVYDLLSARIPGGMPQASVGPLPDGRLVDVARRPLRAAYVVAAYPVELAGSSVATAGNGLVLWRVERPVRLSLWTQRVPGHVRVLAYGCRGGQLRIRAAGPPGARVELRRDDRPLAKRTLGPAGTLSATIAARPARGLCTFDVLTDTATQVPQATFVRS